VVRPFASPCGMRGCDTERQEAEAAPRIQRDRAAMAIQLIFSCVFLAACCACKPMQVVLRPHVFCSRFLRS
jgi:hypothetical protein